MEGLILAGLLFVCILIAGYAEKQDKKKDDENELQRYLDQFRTKRRW